MQQVPSQVKFTAMDKSEVTLLGWKFWRTYENPYHQNGRSVNFINYLIAPWIIIYSHKQKLCDIGVKQIIVLEQCCLILISKNDVLFYVKQILHASCRKWDNSYNYRIYWGHGIAGRNFLCVFNEMLNLAFCRMKTIQLSRCVSASLIKLKR